MTINIKTNVNVAMPTERAFQLRELADALGGATMSETLQKLFQAARDQGLIKGHSIPGVRINALSDGVVIQFDDQERAGFTFDAALALADTVRQFANGTNTTPLFVDMDHEFAVRRKGRGLIVTLNTLEGASEKAWNADIAAEFADLIEKTVATKRPQ
tara:strand:- start:2434 stop:2907 length:474 start_codon:yes stop_codon:yes gene_type:complete